MPLYLVYTMVQKSKKMTKNSNQGGPALSFTTCVERQAQLSEKTQNDLFYSM